MRPVSPPPGWDCRSGGGVTWALQVAALAFTILLGAQLVLAEPDTPETGTSRLVLGTLVAVLLVAVVHLRRRADRGRADE